MPFHITAKYYNPEIKADFYGSPTYKDALTLYLSPLDGWDEHQNTLSKEVTDSPDYLQSVKTFFISNNQSKIKSLYGDMLDSHIKIALKSIYDEAGQKSLAYQDKAKKLTGKSQKTCLDTHRLYRAFLTLYDELKIMKGDEFTQVEKNELEAKLKEYTTLSPAYLKQNNAPNDFLCVLNSFKAVVDFHHKNKNLIKNDHLFDEIVQKDMQRLQVKNVGIIKNTLADPRIFADRAAMNKKYTNKKVIDRNEEIEQISNKLFPL